MSLCMAKHETCLGIFEESILFLESISEKMIIICVVKHKVTLLNR